MMGTTGSTINIVAEELEWKIENFSLTEEQYTSSKVTFLSESWQFVVFPNQCGYIQLGISRRTLGSPIAVEFSLALQTWDGQKNYERGGMEFFDEWKNGCSYRMISISDFESRQQEFLSSGSGCLILVITMKRDVFVEPEGRHHFFQSKYIPMNENSSAPVSHETLAVSTTSDAVRNENVSGEFEWKIKNFSLLEHVYWSPEFTFGSETWKFGAINNYEDGYIDLSVTRKSSDSPILVEYSFALQTSVGQKCFERIETEMFHVWKRACLYFWMETNDFKKRRSEILSSGCLTVIITIRIFDFVKPSNASVSAVSSSHRDCLPGDKIKIEVDKKYLDKPVKCPVCDELLSFQNWFNHECSMETRKGECGAEFQPKNSIRQDLKQEFSSEESCNVALRAEGQESSSQENIVTAPSSATPSTSGNESTEQKKSKFEGIDIYYEILAA